MTHPHAQLIERFYAAFAQRDWSSMADCYHADIHFTDEVFDLHGDQVGLMWKMLCLRGAGLKLDYGSITADAQRGAAQWDARYVFSATGRQVHNSIAAEFAFRDGLIVRHRDSFDFWRWSRQALGATGWLLGWSGLLRRKVQAEAAKNLAAFERKNG